MNNISEGFDAGSNNEFIRFLRYSRRSCSEVQNCLYIALDQRYILTEEFQSSYDHCERIRKMIDGLIRYLRKNNGFAGSVAHDDEVAKKPTDTPYDR